MKYIILTVCLISLAVFANAENKRPNILVVMTDDMGYSDLGCYGSEIETPHLDKLAENGVRFTQFYNTAKCHSSRVALLTGRYCIQAGDVSLSKSVTTAEMLSKAGYFTMMSGKWHLKKQPTDFGFHRYFGHLSGACNFYKGDNTFRLNGKPWKVPEEGFYTTVAKVDFALKFLDEARETKKPWYLYVAFNAPHAPLQPLREDYIKYRGKYRTGWDKIREARLEKQRRLGLFGKDVKAPPRPDHIMEWDKLDDDWKTFERKRMMALAGMIDRIDQEMGRLIEDIKQAGELDNTFILFVSDNGSCPYDRNRSARNLDQKPYDPDIRWADSTGWAWMRNSPFRFYKQNQFEGGIGTPAIVHWPAGLKLKRGSLSHTPLHLIDVLPTLAEISSSPIPDTWPGRELTPVSGISFASLLKGETMTKRPPIHFLFAKDRALRDGDWKLVSFRSQPWELYNMAEDRTELNNLAGEHPDRVEAMATMWHKMTAEVLLARDGVNQPVSGTDSKVNPSWSDHSKPYNTNPPRTKKPSRKKAK